ncbi:MAG: nucleotidyltransferase [Syntrophomonas sp.]
MDVLGIVAEFNPFHNGHLYLIEKAKEQKVFAATVVAMSGNFVQRGEPALGDKWTRAEMALRCGADLIIEIPFCFAARSAYHFARGALQLLSRTGVVTHLAFGTEQGNLAMLQSIAKIITHEPEAYKTILKKYISQGLNYPLSRSLALQEFTGKSEGKLQEALLGPNNILAIEYLHALEEENLPLIPFTVTRQGKSYHSNDLSLYSSATAIRNALLENKPLKAVASAMPPQCQQILQREISRGRLPVRPDSLEQAVLVKLRSSSTDSLKDIYEVSEGLEYRIKEAANSCGSLEELRQFIKSKRYSLSRINRILLYSLFSLSKNQVSSFDKHGPLYLHILGFSSQGQEILQEIKIKSQVKIFSRGSEMKRTYENTKGSVLGDMIALDVYAGDIFSLLFPAPSVRQAGRDFTTSPVII